MKLTRKRKRTIVIAAAAAVLIVGAVAAFLLLRGGGSEGTAYVQRVADITGQGAGALLEGRYSGVIEAKEIIKIKLMPIPLRILIFYLINCVFPIL